MPAQNDAAAPGIGDPARLRFYIHHGSAATSGHRRHFTREATSFQSTLAKKSSRYWARWVGFR